MSFKVTVNDFTTSALRRMLSEAAAMGEEKPGGRMIVEPADEAEEEHRKLGKPTVSSKYSKSKMEEDDEEEDEDEETENDKLVALHSQRGDSKTPEVGEDDLPEGLMEKYAAKLPKKKRNGKKT